MFDVLKSGWNILFQTMKMASRSLILCSCLWFLASPPLSAQQNGIAQDSEIITTPAGDHFLRWYGHVGRSYFIQVSDQDDPLGKWNWAPLIEGGADGYIQHLIGGTAAKVFIRLKYTAQVPGPGETLDTADFDQDGLSNISEITTHATDPLIPDTDADGFTDYEEASAGTAPLDPASFPLKVVGSYPVYAPLYSNALGHPSNRPVILYLNQPLPGTFTSLALPWVFLWDDGVASPVAGVTTILPGRNAVAFVPAGNAFMAWVDEGSPPPNYSISFNQTNTGLAHLIPFEREFSTAVEMLDHGPWVAEFSPGSDYIDVGMNTSINVKWSEPLAPASIIPANVTLASADGAPVGVSVGFDYAKDLNLLAITPTQALAPATQYTVTLSTGFENLTDENHAQSMTWSFTTRPVRLPPASFGPFIVSVSPEDFSFNITPPTSVAIVFSEDMDPATLNAANIHFRAGNTSDLSGTFTYTNTNRTLVFQPSEPFSPFTYFQTSFDSQAILSLPASGNPLPLQGNATFTFSTAAVGAAGVGGEGGAGGAQAPAAINPLHLHYTWGIVAEFDGQGGPSPLPPPNPLAPSIPRCGCKVEIKLTDQAFVPVFKVLPANLDAVQVRDSGPIAPATTVQVTPEFVNGPNTDPEEGRKVSGIYILPTESTPPPGMTYLVFRSTPAASGGSEPADVEYLGVFGPKVSARCADANGNGPQSLFFVSVPIERDRPEDSVPGYRFVENDFAKALPGQQMRFRLEDKYLNNNGPAGVTLPVASMVWTLPEKTFKDYNPTATASNYENLLPADTAAVQQVKYYWRDSGDKELKVGFQIQIASSVEGSASSKAKIHVDKIVSSFGLVVGGERVALTSGNGPDLIRMFGLFPSDAAKVFPGVRFVGSANTPAGWPLGNWAWGQLIKGQRKYTYPGATTHRGDGLSFKLDTVWPYSQEFPTDGTVPTTDDCSDTPRDSLTGQSTPGAPVTARTRVEVHEEFETYLMFKPPGGVFSRYVPLKKATWKWGGVVTSADDWNAVEGPEA